MVAADVTLKTDAADLADLEAVAKFVCEEETIRSADNRKVVSVCRRNIFCCVVFVQVML